MSFRNIIINDRCKLEYSLNYLVCRKGNEEKKVMLDEIKSIIVLSTQVSITTSLICMLSSKKIKIIFCNEKSNPECELVPYINNLIENLTEEEISLLETELNLLDFHIIDLSINNTEIKSKELVIDSNWCIL